MSVEMQEQSARPAWSKAQVAEALRQMAANTRGLPVEASAENQMMALELQQMGVFYNVDGITAEDRPIKPCTVVNPELFNPEKETRATTKVAKKICERICLYREACLDEALAEGIQTGVWGGLNSKERRKLVKPHKSSAA